MQGLPNWTKAPPRNRLPDGRGLRLLVVIPYRDRADNLRELLPALTAYVFGNGAPLLQPLPRICIVEQADALPFNKGALCNAAFRLHEGEFDYLCIHDVDCVPLDADYSFTDLPTRLIAEGTRTVENPDVAFGAVVGMSRADYLRVNGFSNLYRGWGFEDSDMLLRIVRQGMTLEARPGVFRSLPHAASERDTQGKVRPEVFANRERFQQRFVGGDPFWIDDGLSTSDFTLLSSQWLSRAGDASLDIVHHHIRVASP